MRRTVSVLVLAAALTAPALPALAAAPDRGLDTSSANAGDTGWGNCGRNSSGGAHDPVAGNAGRGNGGHTRAEACTAADPGLGPSLPPVPVGGVLS